MSDIYNPGKDNVVVDAPSRMSIGIIAHVTDNKIVLVKEVHRLDRLSVRLEDFSKGGFMVHHTSESSLVVEVMSKKHLDPLLIELKESVLSKFNEAFYQRGDGVHMYEGRFCVPDLDGLRGIILEKVHGS